MTIPANDWLTTAPCKALGPRPFFTPTRYGHKGADVYPPEAVAACAGCRHRAPCLEDALRAPRDWDLGYRAGMTAVEREKVRADRNKARRRGAA